MVMLFTPSPSHIHANIHICTHNLLLQWNINNECGDTILQRFGNRRCYETKTVSLPQSPWAPKCKGNLQQRSERGGGSTSSDINRPQAAMRH
jgi:hypothetical protein